jgi:ankyrin repeat protein
VNRFDNNLNIRYIEVVKYLIEQGADISAKNNCSLRLSAYLGHLEVVKCLIEHGADIHAENDHALRSSATNGYLDMVTYLVVDCNMTVKNETFDYLKVSCLLETINIIKARDLYNQLDNSLNSNITDNKCKKKI